MATILKKFKKCACVFYVLALFLLAIHAQGADYMKTLRTYVYDSEGVLSSAVSPSFSLYIGDNISGVSDPVKSAHISVSGVYTTSGSATLSLTLENDVLSTKTFTLPSVASPTPFTLLYNDETGIINPMSSGTYRYELTIQPVNVEIYGFNAELAASYKYTPPSCADGSSANEKIKTVDTYIYDSEGVLSSAVSPSFSLYIGDNISGVSDPVKSAHISVSGVYTTSGSATLSLTLENDVLSTKTFTLPSVASPTPFTLLYNDETGIINPMSSGTYRYELTIQPVNVEIYGFNAELAASYRYKPPSCGTLPAIGELASSVFESTGSFDGPAYHSILWKGSLLSGNGRVRFQFAASSFPNGPWNFAGGASCSGSDWYDPGSPDTPIELICSPTLHNNLRYFRYKIQLCSAPDCASFGSISPRVDDVVVNWSP